MYSCQDKYNRLSSLWTLSLGSFPSRTPSCPLPWETRFHWSLSFPLYTNVSWQECMFACRLTRYHYSWEGDYHEESCAPISEYVFLAWVSFLLSILTCIANAFSCPKSDCYAGMWALSGAFNGIQVTWSWLLHCTILFALTVTFCYHDTRFLSRASVVPR